MANENADDELLIHQLTGFIVVADIQAGEQKKRIYGFFADKSELEEFVKTSPVKIIAVKKVVTCYREGEGFNYA